jgi:hypothetical protein
MHPLGAKAKDSKLSSAQNCSFFVGGWNFIQLICNTVFVKTAQGM